jgi:gamma-glutamylcyclotransferase (GGCT)/AIG2-like uncharacterized protein YtfP
MQLFVYGTLMRGFSRAHTLRNDQYLGNGFILGELYDIARFPGVVNGNDKVYGELYEIADFTLKKTDLIEDYNVNSPSDGLYIRKSCTVHLETDEITTAFAYFYNKPVIEKTKITNGDYRAFAIQQGVRLDIDWN